MIYVIATVELKEGSKQAFLDIFKSNVPKVKAEAGCIMYEPAVDVPSGLPVQGPTRENVVTVLEAWKDPEALKNHARAPHMKSYRDVTKDMVKSLSIQVLTPA
jgi:quinol monooxygenase YgiN